MGEIDYLKGICVYKTGNSGGHNYYLDYVDMGKHSSEEIFSLMKTWENCIYIQYLASSGGEGLGTVMLKELMQLGETYGLPIFLETVKTSKLYYLKKMIFMYFQLGIIKDSNHN